MAIRPWRFVNRLSRLVVDPERFPDEREEMRAVGMGAVYTRTTHRRGAAARGHDREPLIERYFQPYARAITEAVTERLADGRAVIIDVHSYPSGPLPYELHGDGPRPAVCLGTDAFHTPPGLPAAAGRHSRASGGRELNSPVQRDVRTAGVLRPGAAGECADGGDPPGHLHDRAGRAGRPGLDELAGALAVLVDVAGTVGTHSARG